MREKARRSIIEEIDPPAYKAGRLLDETRRLSGMANIFGFSIASQQVVAALVVLVLLAAEGMLQTILHGTFRLSDVQNYLDNFDRYDSLTSLLLNMLCYISYMFVPFILLVFCLRKKPFELVPIRRIRNKRWLPAAVVISLALSFLSALVGSYLDLFLSFLHLRINVPDIAPPSQPGLVVLYVLFFCVLAPLCEEFIFRGVILHQLRKYGDGFAVVFSSLLFAMMHGNLAQFPLAFLVGLALGFFMIQFDSIWATVLMHACVNSFATLANYVGQVNGNAVGNLLYFGLGIGLLAIALITVFSLRGGQSFKERFPSLFKSEMPMSYLFKRAFLSPGMIVFTILFVLLCVTTLQIV